MRWVLKRVGRVLLYCVVAVVVLSIALRVYSAWHVPRAKRLLVEISQIEAGSPVDEKVRSLLANYKFSRDRDCSEESCNYDVQLTGADIGISIDIEDKVRVWLFEHCLLNLGLRPWFVLAHIETSHGQVTGTGFVLQIADQTLIGVGGSISTSNLQPDSRSINTNFFVDENHKYGSSMLRAQLHPSAPRNLVDSSFTPEFSCVWGLRSCQTGWDVFPRLRPWRYPESQN